MCAICGSVGLAAGAAMAPSNPNASPTDAAAAMVLHMVFPFVLCGRDPRTGHWMALALARFPGGLKKSSSVTVIHLTSREPFGTFSHLTHIALCARTSDGQLHDCQTEGDRLSLVSNSI